MDERPRSEPAAPPPGPPHLADPRTVTILSTEHWSLLTARSLVYNESFTRASMFLTLLSASLVAIGLLYQGSGGSSTFSLIVIAVLTLDLFVGLATVGRVIGAGAEEFRAMQGMGRIRHAYLEMAPALEPYFSAPVHDDPNSILRTYGSALDDNSPLGNLAHGLTTMPGMLSVIVAALAGALAGTVLATLDMSMGLAVVGGIIAGLAVFGASMAYGMRTFSDTRRFLEPRYPAPARMRSP